MTPNLVLLVPYVLAVLINLYLPAHAYSSECFDVDIYNIYIHLLELRLEVSGGKLEGELIEEEA